MLKKAVNIIVLSIFLITAIACSSNENSAVITQTELISRLGDSSAPVIIDVRSVEEYERGHVPGAFNIPFKKMHLHQGYLAELKLDKGDEIVVYCEAGSNAKKFEKYLRKNGFFEVRHLQGDMNSWRRAKLPFQ